MYATQLDRFLAHISPPVFNDLLTTSRDALQPVAVVSHAAQAGQFHETRIV
jgi:hypothetical protein